MMVTARPNKRGLMSLKQLNRYLYLAISPQVQPLLLQYRTFVTIQRQCRYIQVPRVDVNCNRLTH